MMRAVKNLSMFLFFSLLLAATIWASTGTPRILVLHSYSEDYVWTRDINVGLDRVLGGDGSVEIRYHYMETKKHSGSEFKRRAGIAAQHAIANVKPDVVIAVDDNAQKLAAKYFVDHPEINIVFAGINGSIAPYGYDKANNVTGILERKPVRAVVEVIAQLDQVRQREGVSRVLFVSDKSHSAERDAKLMENADWGAVDYLGNESVKTFADWKALIGGIEGRADYILVGGYRKLSKPSANGNSAFAPSREVGEWTEANSPVPVIGLNVFNSSDGIMLSVGASPFEQGETAAEMALSVAHKDSPPNKIAIQHPQQYIVSLHKEALRRRNLDIPLIYEVFARSTNNYVE